MKPFNQKLGCLTTRNTGAESVNFLEITGYSLPVLVHW
jgi:hypothetical protein